MYVEPSSIVAVLREESEGRLCRDVIAAERNKVISVVGLVEASIAMGRTVQNYEIGARLVQQFCGEADIGVVPVSADLFDDVMLAYRRFGKGTGHPAGLNFGDCFSYAYAKRHQMPLLFVGNDFSRTDIQPAL